MKTSYILVIILSLLIAFVIYSYADNIKQSYIKTGYDTGFDEGYKNAIITILGQVEEKGSVTLFKGKELISLTKTVENDKSEIPALNADEITNGASVSIENGEK